MLKFTLFFILILAIFQGCINSHKTSHPDCSIINKYEFNHILVGLPACYKIYNPDTNTKSHFFLQRNDSLKLECITDGLGSLQTVYEIKKDKSIFLYSDTIGKISRQIGYYKKGIKFGVIILFMNFKDKHSFFDDMLNGKEVNSLKKSQYTIILDASTPRDDSLSKKDVNIIINAFKKSKILIESYHVKC